MNVGDDVGGRNSSQRARDSDGWTRIAMRVSTNHELQAKPGAGFTTPTGPKAPQPTGTPQAPCSDVTDCGSASLDRSQTSSSDSSSLAPRHVQGLQIFFRI